MWKNLQSWRRSCRDSSTRCHSWRSPSYPSWRFFTPSQANVWRQQVTFLFNKTKKRFRYHKEFSKKWNILNLCAPLSREVPPNFSFVFDSPVSSSISIATNSRCISDLETSLKSLDIHHQIADRNSESGVAKRNQLLLDFSEFVAAA